MRTIVGARGFNVLLASVFATGFVSAQTASSPGQPQTVFRTGVDLARLDVQVTDELGRPVPDLRADEIQVLESGQARPVLLLHRVVESGRSYAESAERTISSEVSTNAGAPRGQLYVLLFDQEHITAGTEQRVRLAAERFLRERVRPQDRVAVFGLPGPGPMQPLTANVRAAIDQLQRVRGDLDRVPTVATDMRIDEAYEILRGNDSVVERFMATTNGALDRTGVVPDAPGARNAVDPSTMRLLIREHAQALVTVADASARRFLDLTVDMLHGLRGIDGRKTVLLFSEGFHADNVSREIERVSAAAAETYAVIQSFDLNRRAPAIADTAPGMSAASEVANRLEPLGTLALDTNGSLVIDAATRLDDAMGALAAASIDYYVVGFAASAAALANRDSYRHVSVQVRRPGTHVSVRSGYSAGPAATIADRRRAIDTALAAPFTQQGLKVAYTTYVGQSEIPGRQRVAVSLETELPLSSESGGAADVVFVVRHATTGQIVASGTDQIPLPSQAAPGSTLGRSAWRVGFDTPAGNYIMRCVVREPGGLVGSADRRFTVLPLDGVEAGASDLILGSAGAALPVRAVAYSSEVINGALRLYARSADQVQDVSARLELLPAGAEATTPIRVVDGEIAASQANGRTVLRDVSFAVPMADLEAGEYVARAVIRARGEVIADLRRQLVVRLGSRPEESPAMAGSTAPEPREVLRGSLAARLIAHAAASQSAAARRAAEEARAGRWTAAAGVLKSAPADDPGLGTLLGLVRIADADYAGAVAILSRELERQPDDAALAFVLGWARVGAGDHSAAASAFRVAAFLEPRLVAAHLALADAYLRLGQPALAMQAVQAGLTHSPESPELRSLLDRLRKQHVPSPAIPAKKGSS